jgi:hypothetical protein
MGRFLLGFSIALHTHAVRSEMTCRIELCRTPSGITYCLDDEPLSNGDTLEIWTTLGWVKGIFVWEGEPYLPYINAISSDKHLEPFVIVASSVCRRPLVIKKTEN